MEPSDPTDRIKWRTRGWLPHAERPGAIYFVTFRLAGSLPAGFLRRVREERVVLEKRLDDRGDALRPDVKRKLDLLDRRRIERALDVGHGECWLRHPAVAELVAQALAYFNSQRYILGPWCVMPNHVHALLRPLPTCQLDDILHSWKSFTASEGNRVLGRSGSLWHREYYDRLVRNRKVLERCANYILSNPARAGLHDWKWVGKGNLDKLMGEE